MLTAMHAISRRHGKPIGVVRGVECVAVRARGWSSTSVTRVSSLDVVVLLASAPLVGYQECSLCVGKLVLADSA